jgi:radical SAM protein with 4Fe4S-binding SPASM domain
MPFQVGWDITHHCNFRCKHCYFGSDELADRQSMTLREALDFVDYLADKRVFHLSIAGGEPLLYPHIKEVVAAATRRGIVVAMSTNASLLTSNLAGELKDAGLDSLQISLDGSCAEVNDRIRGNGSFNRTMRGLRTAIGHQFKVLVACVVLRPNAHDIAEIVDLAAREGAVGIKVQTFIQGSGLAAQNDMDLALPAEDVIAVIRPLWGRKQEWETRLPLVILPMVPGVSESDGEPESNPRQSCLGCQPGISTIRVAANGDVRACGALREPEEILGNIKRSTLQEIWLESDRLVQLRNREQVNRGLSGSACNTFCGKGCRSIN